MSQRTEYPFRDRGRYVEVHNVIFDYIMPRIKPTSFKVLCYVLRMTKGWGNLDANLSFNDLKLGTGIKSDHTINASIKELLAEKCIKKSAGIGEFDANNYSLNLDFKIKISDEITTAKNAVLPTAKNAVEEQNPTAKNTVDTTAKNAVLPTAKNADIYKSSTNQEINIRTTPYGVVLSEKIPNIDSPLAMELRTICRKPIILSENDRKKMIEALIILESQNATVEQMQEFGRKVHLHWCGQDRKTRQARAPGIVQVAENWLAVLEININEMQEVQNDNGTRNDRDTKSHNERQLNKFIERRGSRASTAGQ